LLKASNSSLQPVLETFVMMADEKVVIFENVNLPAQGFAHMEEIRRQGKLCDVTLKVGW